MRILYYVELIPKKPPVRMFYWDFTGWLCIRDLGRLCGYGSNGGNLSRYARGMDERMVQQFRVDGRRLWFVRDRYFEDFVAIYVLYSLEGKHARKVLEGFRRGINRVSH